MATEPWPVGTDAGEKLRFELRAFIKAWFSDEKYKARLPRKQHLTILDEGKREGAGIIVRVVSASDPRSPWTYTHKPSGRPAVEDWHQVAVFVKADRSSGGADSVSAVLGALRSLFACRPTMPERDMLETHGVHECSETVEGLITESGNPEDEGTQFKQQVNLTCNTDSFLS